MKFTPELAAEIAEKYNISAVTVRVWKTRGKIPDKYAAPLPSLVSPAKKNAMREVLSLPQLKYSSCVSLPLHRMSDVKRDRAQVTLQEYIAFKQEISNLKNEISEFVATPLNLNKEDYKNQLLKILDNRLLVVSELCSLYCAGHLRNFKNKFGTVQNPAAECVNELRKNLRSFAAKLIL